MTFSVPYDFVQGHSPLLVSMPHSGLQLTPEVASTLIPEALALPDTDWHIPQLYDFLEAMGVGVIKANYSRYVIDLNRPEDDKPLYAGKTTGLFPHILFNEKSMFKPGAVADKAHQQACIENIWRPYHLQLAAALTRIKQKFGYAILFDAHSIRAQVPMFFEGTLPDFNMGTNGGASCSPKLLQAAERALSGSAYTQVSNGRFKGGYITRSNGQPHDHVHAFQLELSQTTYMQDSGSYALDNSKCNQVIPQLKALIEALVSCNLTSQ
ncbi:N-formylglutamate deformylase [Candidatus Njordibacter sp. Uisw_056]|jgi:formiminoglutamase|uniref:N-formylglutamate deformylase n=1 Tax=Candidatus Njordibacter sp. Uisw_056 TaxID=3230973 RepID=UPI003D4E65A6|tara:strand:+ start:15738 stop:16538 length:801 start_codon:yes stop_codon:yes gene_type:complete